jgi:hypothetical protein
MRNASKVPKGLNVSPEKTFLVLRGETSGVRATRVTQVHHEKLHLLSLATKDGHGLTPIHLSILARLEFQWQKKFRGMVSLFPGSEVLPDTRLTALVALSLDHLKDPMRGVPLLAGEMVILSDECFNACLKRSKDGSRSKRRRGDGFERRWLVRDSSPDGLVTVTSLTLDLADRFAFNMECTTDELLLIRWELHRRSPFNRAG